MADSWAERLAALSAQLEKETGTKGYSEEIINAENDRWSVVDAAQKYAKSAWESLPDIVTKPIETVAGVVKPVAETLYGDLDTGRGGIDDAAVRGLAQTGRSAMLYGKSVLEDRDPFSLNESTKQFAETVRGNFYNYLADLERNNQPNASERRFSERAAEITAEERAKRGDTLGAAAMSAARAFGEGGTDPELWPGLVATVVSSLPESLSMLGGAALGSVGGPGGAAGGSFLAGYPLSYGRNMEEFLSSRGVNTGSYESLSSAFKDPELLKDAQKFAAGAGIPETIFNVLSLQVAGRLYDPVKRAVSKTRTVSDPRLGREVTEISGAIPSSAAGRTAQNAAGAVAGGVAESGAQAALGALSETGRQLGGYGEIVDPASIGLEALVEVPLGAVEAATMREVRGTRDPRFEGASRTDRWGKPGPGAGPGGIVPAAPATLPEAPVARDSAVPLIGRDEPPAPPAPSESVEQPSGSLVQNTAASPAQAQQAPAAPAVLPVDAQPSQAVTAQPPAPAQDSQAIQQKRMELEADRAAFEEQAAAGNVTARQRIKAIDRQLQTLGKQTGQVVLNQPTVLNMEGDVTLPSGSRDIFESGLSRTLRDGKAQTMPATQWAAFITNKQGVKPQELEYTGVIDKLKAAGNAKLTNLEVADIVDSLQPKVSVTDMYPKDAETSPKDSAPILPRVEPLYGKGTRRSQVSESWPPAQKMIATANPMLLFNKNELIDLNKLDQTQIEAMASRRVLSGRDGSLSIGRTSPQTRIPNRIAGKLIPVSEGPEIEQASKQIGQRVLDMTPVAPGRTENLFWQLLFTRGGQYKPLYRYQEKLNPDDIPNYSLLLPNENGDVGDVPPIRRDFMEQDYAKVNLNNKVDSRRSLQRFDERVHDYPAANRSWSANASSTTEILDNTIAKWGRPVISADGAPVIQTLDFKSAISNSKGNSFPLEQRRFLVHVPVKIEFPQNADASEIGAWSTYLVDASPNTIKAVNEAQQNQTAQEYANLLGIDYFDEYWNRTYAASEDPVETSSMSSALQQALSSDGAKVSLLQTTFSDPSNHESNNLPSGLVSLFSEVSDESYGPILIAETPSGYDHSQPITLRESAGSRVSHYANVANYSPDKSRLDGSDSYKPLSYGESVIYLSSNEPGYENTHFPNVYGNLTHVRYSVGEWHNKQTQSNERVLVIEEVQSDVHGRASDGLNKRSVENVNPKLYFDNSKTLDKAVDTIRFLERAGLTWSLLDYAGSEVATFYKLILMNLVGHKIRRPRTYDYEFEYLVPSNMRYGEGGSIIGNNLGPSKDSSLVDNLGDIAVNKDGAVARANGLVSSIDLYKGYEDWFDGSVPVGLQENVYDRFFDSLYTLVRDRALSSSFADVLEKFERANVLSIFKKLKTENANKGNDQELLFLHDDLLTIAPKSTVPFDSISGLFDLVAKLDERAVLDEQDRLIFFAMEMAQTEANNSFLSYLEKPQHGYGNRRGLKLPLISTDKLLNADSFNEALFSAAMLSKDESAMSMAKEEVKKLDREIERFISWSTKTDNKAVFQSTNANFVLYVNELQKDLHRGSLETFDSYSPDSAEQATLGPRVFKQNTNLYELYESVLIEHGDFESLLLSSIYRSKLGHYDYPFSKTDDYTELGLKTLFAKAAELGVDRVVGINPVAMNMLYRRVADDTVIQNLAISVNRDAVDGSMILEIVGEGGRTIDQFRRSDEFNLGYSSKTLFRNKLTEEDIARGRVNRYLDDLVEEVAVNKNTGEIEYGISKNKLIGVDSKKVVEQIQTVLQEAVDYFSNNSGSLSDAGIDVFQKKIPTPGAYVPLQKASGFEVAYGNVLTKLLRKYGTKHGGVFEKIDLSNTAKRNLVFAKKRNVDPLQFVAKPDGSAVEELNATVSIDLPWGVGIGGNAEWTVNVGDLLYWGVSQSNASTFQGAWLAVPEGATRLSMSLSPNDIEIMWPLVFGNSGDVIKSKKNVEGVFEQRELAREAMKALSEAPSIFITPKLRQFISGPQPLFIPGDGNSQSAGDANAPVAGSRNEFPGYTTVRARTPKTVPTRLREKIDPVVGKMNTVAPRYQDAVTAMSRSNGRIVDIEGVSAFLEPDGSYTQLPGFIAPIDAFTSDQVSNFGRALEVASRVSEAAAPGLFDGVAGFGKVTGTQLGVFMGNVGPDSNLIIGLRDSLLMDASPESTERAVFVLLHEGSHSADRRVAMVRNRGPRKQRQLRLDSEAREVVSKIGVSPDLAFDFVVGMQNMGASVLPDVMVNPDAFVLKEEPDGLTQTVVYFDRSKAGPVFLELFDALKVSPLDGVDDGRLFSYPIDNFLELVARAKVYGKGDPRAQEAVVKAMMILNAEMTAQLGAMYNSDPQLLLKMSPTGYKVIKEFFDEFRKAGPAVSDTSQRGIDSLLPQVRSLPSGMAMEAGRGRGREADRRVDQDGGAAREATRAEARTQPADSPVLASPVVQEMAGRIALPPNYLEIVQGPVNNIVVQGRGNPVQQVARYLDRMHRQNFGRINTNNPFTQRAFDRAIQTAKDEMTYQIRLARSGEGWYTDDIQKAFKITAEFIPEIQGNSLEAIHNRALFLGMAGVISPSVRAVYNWDLAAVAFEHYARTGIVPPTNPLTGNLWMGGLASSSKAPAMQMLQYLIDTMGPGQAAEFLVVEQRIKDLRDLRRASGIYRGDNSIAGNMNDLVLGYQILGPKVGSFVMNLLGIDDVTVDRWNVRSFNRYFGTMLWRLGPDGLAMESPRNESERRLMKDFVTTLADEISGVLGRTVQRYDSQALEWFFEQSLYTKLGVNSPSDYMSDGAERYARQRRERDERAGSTSPVLAAPARGGQGRRAATLNRPTVLALEGDGNRGTAPEARPTGGNQERTAAQIADRVRGEFPGTPRVEEGTARDGNVGRRRGGVLADDLSGRVPVESTYSHSEGVKAAYADLGIATPDFHELTTGTASAELYSRLINEAKAGNRFGASVYVYPTEEYTNMRLFLTSDGTAGFALKGDDIVSAFKGRSPHVAVAYSMVRMAVALGGRRLDAFDTVLPRIYSVSGFRVASRLPWDDQQAPSDWSKDTFKAFKNGEPDVVFMAYDEARTDVYQPGEGQYASDYGTAVDLQTQAAQSKATQKPASTPPAGEDKVDIPIGRSGRAKESVQRYWYHSPRGRDISPGEGIKGYELRNSEVELAEMFRGATDSDNFVFLSPTPFTSNAVSVDISKFADRVRRTGQAEGYAVVLGDIPADAVSAVEQELAPSAEDAAKLAEAAGLQRGPAESAMVEAQKLHGGGVLSFVIEHAGDIYQRMHNTGYGPLGNRSSDNERREVVLEKIGKVMRVLASRYGFEREHQENMESNPRSMDVPPQEYRDRLEKALTRYADEHRKLPVYNLPQKLARQASIALGEGRYGEARLALWNLQDLAKDPEKWFSVINAIDPGISQEKSGQVKLNSPVVLEMAGPRNQNRISQPPLPKGIAAQVTDYLKENAGFSKIDLAAINDGETFVDRMIRRVQDNFARVKRYEKAAADAAGVHLLPHWFSPYRAEERMHGKIKEQFDALEKTFVEPMSQFLKDNDITLDELGLFLIAKHAEERNAEIALINPQMPDGGSGMMTQDALDILNRVDQQNERQMFEDAAKFVYDMNEWSRKLLVKSQLEDPFVVGTWKAKYDWYVPLQGFAYDESTGPAGGPGRGVSVGGRETRQALGRDTRSFNPVVMSILQASNKIVRAEKNEVARAFYNMVRRFPSPAWQEIDGSLLERTFNDVTGMVEYRPVNPMTAKFRGDQVFEVKYKGGTKYILVRDKLLLRALMNLGKDNLSDDSLIRPVMNAGRTIMNYMSGVLTRWSPVWFLYNFPKDVFSGLVNASTEATKPDGLLRGRTVGVELLKELGNFSGGLPLQRALFRHLKGRQGTTPEELAWDAVTTEFFSSGGATGWVRFRTIEEEQKRLMKMSSRKLVGDSAKNFIKSYAAAMETMNDILENSIRLAGFKAARDKGLSKQDAANFSKSMTINFNKKGEWTDTFGSIYMFANANIQGSRQFIRSMSSKKAAKIMASMAGLTALVTMINIILMEMDGEDYEDVPDWIKQTTLPIYLGDGKFFTWPLPYGYSIFTFAATKMTEMLMKRSTPEDAAWAVTGKIASDFSPLMFPDGEAQALRALAGTAAAPFLDIATNQTRYGTNIYPNRFPGDSRPDSQVTKQSTPKAFKEAAETLNEVTGGSEFRSGMVDLHPETIRYLLQTAGGGLATTLFQAMDFADDPTDLTKAPFYNRFVRTLGKDKAAVSAFYESRERFNQIQEEYDSLRGQPRIDFRMENKNELRIAADYDVATKRLNEIYKTIKKINANGKLSDEQKEKMLEVQEEKLAKVYLGWYENFKVSRKAMRE